MLSLDVFWMGRDRQYASELTDEIKDNAKVLVDKVNALLSDLGWDKDVSVSSGWRPQTVNQKTAGAGAKSPHTMGMAVDIIDDKNQTLAKLILGRPELLEKHGLWLESPDHTKGKWTNWVHLDTKQRSKRAIQVFNP